MATNPSKGTQAPLIERVKNILITPKTEWPVIDAEPATIGGIYRNYVMILAAIGPICMLIGLLVFGMPYVSFSMGYLLAQAVISYVMALVGCYILALIIDALAPSFGGTKDMVKAFKVPLMRAPRPGSSVSSTCCRCSRSSDSSAASTASICCISACPC